MPDQLQLRGGTTVQHSTFTGASKEVTVDTTKKTAVIHDGSTAGGNPLMREDGSNSALALGSAGSPSLKWDANTGLYSPGADQVAISTGGSGRLFVDSSGRVGINTTPSVYRLDVGGNGIRARESDNSSALVLGTYDAGGYAYISSDKIGTGSYQPLTFFTGASERLRITSAGLVGVGGSPIAARLASFTADVGGTIGDTAQIVSVNTNGAVGDFSGIRFNYYNDGNTGGKFAYIGSVLTSGVGNGASDIVFGTRPTSTTTISERLRITSDGKVGVGTSSPSSALHIVGQVQGVFNTTWNDSTAWGFAFKNSTNTSKQLWGGYDNTADIAIIQSTHVGTAHKNLALNPNGGNVGIGTSAPGTVLDISAAQAIVRATSSTGTNYVLYSATNGTGSSRMGVETSTGGGLLTGSSANSTVLGSSSNHSLHLGTNATTALTIDTSQRVGIGTTSPGGLLDVYASAGNNLVRIGGAAGTSNGIYFRAQNTNYAEIYYSDSGSYPLVIGTKTGAGPIIFNTVDNERARIDSSGRLLLGTSSARTNVDGYAPIFQAEVAGSSDALNRLMSFTYGRNNGGGGGVFAFNRHSSITVGGQGVVAVDYNLGQIKFNGSDGTNFIGAAEIKAEVDGTPGTNDMPGRLVFSTTADGASSPTERMRISQGGLVSIAGPGGGTFLKLDNSGGYNGFHELDNTAYTIGQNSASRVLRMGSGSNWLTTGVNLAAGGTSWGTYSDERLKTDIVELSDCLDSIKGIRCVSYRLTDVDATDSKKRLGIIAQDLVGKYDEAVNESRRSDEDETEYLSVQYTDLVPVLIKALQEASSKIETLEARLTALESA